MFVASVLLAFVGFSSSHAVHTDTIRLEVGAKELDGRVYARHAARVRVWVGPGQGRMRAEWTNVLTVGDSAGRQVHRWVTTAVACARNTNFSGNRLVATGDGSPGDEQAAQTVSTSRQLRRECVITPANPAHTSPGHAAGYGGSRGSPKTNASRNARAQGDDSSFPCPSGYGDESPSVFASSTNVSPRSGTLMISEEIAVQSP